MGYKYTSIGGSKDDKLNAYGRAKQYSDGSNKVPLAAVPMTGKEAPLSYSNSHYWFKAAPVENPAYPSNVADLTMDFTSRIDAQRPQEMSDMLTATYLVQSKSQYGHGSQVYSRKKFFSGYPPPPPFFPMVLRPDSDQKWGK